MFNFNSERTEKEWLVAQSIIKSIGMYSRNGDGGINPGDQRALFYISRYYLPKATLEIGTHLAYSTIALALGANENIVFTVDKKDINAANGAWFRYGKKLPPNQLFKMNGITNVIFKNEESEKFLSKNAKYDLIFVDGDHSKKGCIKDIILSKEKLNQNGVIILHDYFPDGEQIWEGKKPIVGPYEACLELGIEPIPLGELPWETKLDTKKTTLAIIQA